MTKTHVRLCLGVSTLAAVLGVASATTVARTSTAVARGHFSFATDFTKPLRGGKNAAIGQFTYQGGVTGVSIDYGTQTVNSNGSFAGRGTEYCVDCSIRGKAGAFIATFTYSGVRSHIHGPPEVQTRIRQADRPSGRRRIQRERQHQRQRVRVPLHLAVGASSRSAVPRQ
jgi:hypothetical protein